MVAYTSVRHADKAQNGMEECMNDDRTAVVYRTRCHRKMSLDGRTQLSVTTKKKLIGVIILNHIINGIYG